MTRDACAAAPGIDAERVTLLTPAMGGGFGGRTDPVPVFLAARVAATMPGTPVKLTHRQEEGMTQDSYRPAAIARMSGRAEAGCATAL